MIDDNFKIAQLATAPGGIFAGEPLPGGGWWVSQVVGLALGEDEDGRQEVRAVTLSETGAITVTSWLNRVFIQNMPDSRIFNRR